MTASPHRFPLQQEEFLRALKRGTYACGCERRGARATSLVNKMPPVYQQSLRGTCVANAVTALLEYYGDCRTRLSVQFLFAATKEIERDAVERNLMNLYAARPLDAAFESVYHGELLQLRMLADANGGMESPAVRPYYMRFVESVRAHFARTQGCLLISAFRAVETRGVCRHALWPYSGASSAPLFGRDGEAVTFPPGSREDALKHTVTHGLYLLGTPNNVDEIRGILSGANSRRKMPVAVTVDFFEGCDGETYAFPETAEDMAGNLVSKNEYLGRHGLLIVGYVDHKSYPGGGYFIVRNSFGEAWGNRGYGKLPYAYLECFALEAGTILQDLIDYSGDGYDGSRSGADLVTPSAARNVRRFGRIGWNLAIGAAIVAITIGVGVLFDDPLKLSKSENAPRESAGAPKESDNGQSGAREFISYKVFFSCRDAEERRALRNAMASEGVTFAVEFLPQTLDTVLALRLTFKGERNVSDEISKVMRESYCGPRKEMWCDIASLVKNRQVYITSANRH